MSTIDQCPSSKGKLDIPVSPGSLHEVSGKPYWRSVEEFAQTDHFREFVEREFPAGASELAGSEGESRREFLKLMAASMALAGAATVPGCRRPDHKIYAYSANEPERVIPGKPLFYATSMPLPGGGAEGLLVETHQARPTKIEGNPLHPLNRGKSSALAQSEVLRLYDPDRPVQPTFYNKDAGERRRATWDDFKVWQTDHFAAHEEDGGSELAFIVDRRWSPTLQDMKRRVMRRFPEATWVWWDPVDARRSELDGTRAAIGAPSRVFHDFSKAGCVLSLDADFTGEGPGHLRAARDFARTRQVMKSGDSISRLYAVESRPTGTGSLADHRFAASPSRISAFCAAVAKELAALRGSEDDALARALENVDATGGAEPVFQHAKAIAEDLHAHAESRAGSAFVVAGQSQPAEVHTLVVVINDLLGATNRSVNYTAEDAEFHDAPFEQLRSLTEKINGGGIRTLVCAGVNPAYDAPADLRFAEAMQKVATTITHDFCRTETMAGSTWTLSGAHWLESWGDTEAWDGTAALTQPMIAPIFDPALSEIELLALLSGVEDPDGYALVQQVWSRRSALSQDSSAFKKRFRRALQDGVWPETASPLRPSVRGSRGAAARAVRTLADQAANTPSGEALEVTFTAGRVSDGRFANVGWLQELPQMGTSVVWDNPAIVSPRTAERLRVLPVGQPTAEGDLAGAYTRGQEPKARMATLTLDGRTLEMPVWILPGMPDNVVHLQLGYGRSEVGRVGRDVGFNTYALRSTKAPHAARGATLERMAKTFPISSTQIHWSMESRETIVRAMDRKWFEKHAAEFEKKEGGVKKIPDEIYGTTISRLNLAEKMGELSHTPPNISAYENPQNESRRDAEPGSQFAQGPQWGMSIDMNMCTGCGVCTVACQAENNIPIVGKTEVAKGREMTWIRVDRYFAGDDLNNPTEMFHQAVACVHCENAPCETVCPVNATVHGTMGTNNMAYNRCIGTRYCANNCPYKVRRFNFFEYGALEYNGALRGDWLQERFDLPDQRRFNKNLIPPRLREKLDEISEMQKNPDVTIRSRGVMEKCTYCIQRINAARQEVKIRDIWEPGQNIQMGENYQPPIPDGFFQTACQQACPSDAIVFGDVLDQASRVNEMRETQRTYALLGYLNTRPRTTHMIRVRNPNPAVGVYDEHDPLHHGGGHEGGEEGDHGETAWVDPRRRGETGYRASLKVMG